MRVREQIGHRHRPCPPGGCFLSGELFSRVIQAVLVLSEFPPIWIRQNSCPRWPWTADFTLDRSNIIDASRYYKYEEIQSLETLKGS